MYKCEICGKDAIPMWLCRVHLAYLCPEHFNEHEHYVKTELKHLLQQNLWYIDVRRLGPLDEGSWNNWNDIQLRLASEARKWLEETKETYREY
jgi:hypothetical protein